MIRYYEKILKIFEKISDLSLVKFNSISNNRINIIVCNFEINYKYNLECYFLFISMEIVLSTYGLFKILAKRLP